MLKIEGIEHTRKLSRQEWEDVFERFAGKYLKDPNGTLIKPERIAVWTIPDSPEELEVRLVTGRHVFKYSVEEFVSKFTQLNSV